MTVRSVDDHAWYKALRRAHPDKDECWVWTRRKMQVDAGEFWRDRFGSERVSVRPYLKACLLGDGTPKSYEPGLEAGADCESRACVNPRHVERVARDENAPGDKRLPPVELAAGRPRTKIPRDEIAEEQPMEWMYLIALLNAVWNATYGPLEDRPIGYKTIAEAKRSLAERYPFVTSHFARMKNVTAMWIITGRKRDELAILDECGFRVKDGTIPRAFRVPLGLGPDDPRLAPAPVDGYLDDDEVAVARPKAKKAVRKKAVEKRGADA